MAAGPATTGTMPYVLDIGGTMAGILHYAEGGEPYAEVIIENIGADGLARKHLGRIRYAPIHMDFGPNMGERLYEFIKGSLARSSISLDGALISATFDHTEVGRLTFTSALFAELRLPELDARSKEAVHLRLKIAPEVTKRQAGSSQKLKLPAAGKARMFMPGNFRLAWEGAGDVGEACKYLVKIDAITVKADLSEEEMGSFRDPVRGLGVISTSDLVVTLPESRATGFFKWFEAFVLKGEQEKNEANAVLAYLSADQKKTLMEVKLHNLGVHKYEMVKPATPDAVRLVRFHMYVEQTTIESFPKAEG